MLSAGIFITFEGGDGTGKSTQLKLLGEALAGRGWPVVTTREPGGTPQAERIRNLLLQRDSGAFDPMTEALLMFASRNEHLVNKIWPEMEKGAVVISDRFADSTRVFQGVGMGLSREKIEALYQAVAGSFEPDLTFVFDIDPEVGLQRSMQKIAAAQNAVQAKEDRYERMGMAFHQKLRQGFLDLARAYPARCVLMDAARDVETIHQDVLKTVLARFSKGREEAGRHSHG